MEFDDYLEPEVAVTAAVTAAVCYPRVRKLLRRGAVYGMAGMLVAKEKISLFTQNVAQGFQEAQQQSKQKHMETVKHDGSVESHTG